MAADTTYVLAAVPARPKAERRKPGPAWPGRATWPAWPGLPGLACPAWPGLAGLAWPGPAWPDSWVKYGLGNFLRARQGLGCTWVDPYWPQDSFSGLVGPFGATGGSVRAHFPYVLIFKNVSEKNKNKPFSERHFHFWLSYFAVFLCVCQDTLLLTATLFAQYLNNQ